MRQTIEATRFENLQPGTRISASLGVTQYQSGESSDLFFGRADEALYAAKHAGRNRSVSLG